MVLKYRLIWFKVNFLLSQSFLWTNTFELIKNQKQLGMKYGLLWVCIMLVSQFEDKSSNMVRDQRNILTDCPPPSSFLRMTSARHSKLWLVSWKLQHLLLAEKLPLLGFYFEHKYNQPLSSSQRAEEDWNKLILIVNHCGFNNFTRPNESLLHAGPPSHLLPVLRGIVLEMFS